jgi:hypothetical protein
MDILVPTVGGRVSPLDTDPLEIENPLQTGRSRGGSGTTEPDSLLPNGKVVVHPVTDGILGRNVGLSRLIGFVEEESRLDGRGPAVLERVPITELVRTPKHRNVLETKVVSGSLNISFVDDEARE